MENTRDDTLRSRRGLHGFSALSFQELIRSKEDEDREAFNKLMQTILPDVEGYIARRLSASVRNGQIPLGKYKVGEFVNELYLMAFEQIGEIEDEKDLPYWLFQKADGLLENVALEEELNGTFLENIEKYSKAEWDAMQEDFNTDDEGDPMSSEPFDDPTYPKYEYRLEDVFNEDPEGELLEMLIEEIGTDKIHDHVDMVLEKLPLPIRSVYDLEVNQGFRPHEIARIKHHSVKRVETFLAKARGIVRQSIEQRFLRNRS